MPKKSMELLTESMFYVLMALQTGPMCGIDAAEFIELERLRQCIMDAEAPEEG